ncbi:hypothetical protein HNQ56_002317 [Anaerotaenia torta]|uniref:hypothetical protein n=1 Tax=Anaerotaenia torta TaxID=433293 RepID=UPI003D1FB2A8
MSTSDIEGRYKQISKISFVYLIIALFCALFGAIYEHFSHEVYSDYMVYAFAFPLAGGTLPYMILSMFGCKCLPGRLSLNLYNSGIAALTVGSIMQGVLDIYGTSNDLLKVYWFAGVGFTLTGLSVYALRDSKIMHGMEKLP